MQVRARTRTQVWRVLCSSGPLRPSVVCPGNPMGSKHPTLRLGQVKVTGSNIARTVSKIGDGPNVTLCHGGRLRLKPSRDASCQVWQQLGSWRFWARDLLNLG